MGLKENLEELVELIDPECKPLADSIITELSFMNNTLKELRDRINSEGAITTYDNGKTEILVQSPAFKGYYTLIPKYNALIKELIDLIPKNSQNTGMSQLEQFMNEYN